LELISHSNVISTNALNTVNANAIEKSKLGEAGFVEYDIFSSPTPRSESDCFMGLNIR
jgi:hypothetical protein